MLYSQFYMGLGECGTFETVGIFETMGILEDHGIFWGDCGIFWGPWEICPACISQFQFLSYMRHYICYQSSQSFQSSQRSQTSQTSQRFCPLQRRSFFFRLLEWGTSFLRLQELRCTS